MQFKIVGKILTPWKVSKTIFMSFICISFHPWILRLVFLRELGFAVSVNRNFPAKVWKEILLENHHCKYHGLASSLSSAPEKRELAFEILPEPILK